MRRRVSLDDTLLTISEAAEFCRCHDKTLRRAISSGGLDAVKVGTVWRISEVSLMAWLRRNTRAANQRPQPRNINRLSDYREDDA